MFQDLLLLLKKVFLFFRPERRPLREPLDSSSFVRFLADVFIASIDEQSLGKRLDAHLQTQRLCFGNTSMKNISLRRITKGKATVCVSRCACKAASVMNVVGSVDDVFVLDLRASLFLSCAGRDIVEVPVGGEVSLTRVSFDVWLDLMGKGGELQVFFEEGTDLALDIRLSMGAVSVPRVFTRFLLARITEKMKKSLVRSNGFRVNLTQLSQPFLQTWM
ncbi:MAG: uncharacterized protein A8A55_0598 [Amphiamblys sp. WSBS2006]|nr:MAG: uncharacterized protein A8A55_0598 [Amphiamblys sp. WSBS2006]